MILYQKIQQFYGQRKGVFKNMVGKVKNVGNQYFFSLFPQYFLTISKIDIIILSCLSYENLDVLIPQFYFIVLIKKDLKQELFVTNCKLCKCKCKCTKYTDRYI